MKKLTIIVPAYNEEEVLFNTIKILNNIEDQLIDKQLFQFNSDILIIDDGSCDHTWQIIEQQHHLNPRIKGIKFSRNFGHQNALLAGLEEAYKTADAMVTIDADLQDDPKMILKMATEYFNGADIVYGVRNNRETDTWFKRNTAMLFYKSLNLLGVQLVQNHADFRLMSKRSVAVLLSYREQNLFIRGIIPKLGFKTAKVYYKRTPRMAGTSKYPLKKMLKFAWDGVTALTIAPIRFISSSGILAILIGLLLFIAQGIGWNHHWFMTVASVWFLGGLQLLGIGIVGEYIGKIGTQVRQRPRYTIEETLR